MWTFWKSTVIISCYLSQYILILNFLQRIAEKKSKKTNNELKCKNRSNKVARYDDRDWHTDDSDWESTDKDDDDDANDDLAITAKISKTKKSKSYNTIDDGDKDIYLARYVIYFYDFKNWSSKWLFNFIDSKNGMTPKLILNLTQNMKS